MTTHVPDPRNARHDAPTVWERAVSRLLGIIAGATVITAISTTVLMFDALND
jgi:hypothetical protein